MLPHVWLISFIFFTFDMVFEFHEIKIMYTYLEYISCINQEHVLL